MRWALFVCLAGCVSPVADRLRALVDAGVPFRCSDTRDCPTGLHCGAQGLCYDRSLAGSVSCRGPSDCADGWVCVPERVCVDARGDALPAGRPLTTRRVSPVWSRVTALADAPGRSGRTTFFAEGAWLRSTVGEPLRLLARLDGGAVLAATDRCDLAASGPRVFPFCEQTMLASFPLPGPPRGARSHAGFAAVWSESDLVLVDDRLAPERFGLDPSVRDIALVAQNQVVKGLLVADGRRTRLLGDGGVIGEARVGGACEALPVAAFLGLSPIVYSDAPEVGLGVALADGGLGVISPRTLDWSRCDADGGAGWRYDALCGCDAPVGLEVDDRTFSEPAPYPGRAVCRQFDGGLVRRSRGQDGGCRDEPLSRSEQGLALRSSTLEARTSVRANGVVLTGMGPVLLDQRPAAMWRLDAGAAAPGTTRELRQTAWGLEPVGPAQSSAFEACAAVAGAESLVVGLDSTGPGRLLVRDLASGATTELLGAAARTRCGGVLSPIATAGADGFLVLDDGLAWWPTSAPSERLSPVADVRRGLVLQGAAVVAGLDGGTQAWVAASGALFEVGRSTPSSAALVERLAPGLPLFVAGDGQRALLIAREGDASLVLSLPARQPLARVPGVASSAALVCDQVLLIIGGRLFAIRTGALESIPLEGESGAALKLFRHQHSASVVDDDGTVWSVSCEDSAP